MEEGFVTLAKILGTLLGSMIFVPVVFMFLGGGERREPDDKFSEV